ncbi:MAG: DNA topoisomerase IB [Rhizobiaceae bacterium]|nr:DNA topoisomerase IB [Rhizobiaceae bacterium]
MNKRLALQAETLGLVMVDPKDFGIERMMVDDKHQICFTHGEEIADPRVAERVQAMVIPPAWSDVRICIEENGHIQAIGRDEKGRLQYRYHDLWVNVRNALKTERLMRFGRSLPKLRRRIAKDMRRKIIDRRATAAIAARLVDLEAMRPGHEKYAADGGRGVASLQRSNIRLTKRGAMLKFVGKSGKAQVIEITDKPLLQSLARVRKLKDKRLFSFPEPRAKKPRRLTATLLNDYLREAAEARVSAKDFRTFHGSAEALRFLIQEAGTDLNSASKRKRAIAAAMRSVSQVLRNTPAVARASYVHPEIVTAYEEERLDPDLLKGRRREGLTQVETGLMRFLEEVATR